jgi:hypothetical protein
MPINREQFDADLSQNLAAVTDYIAAVDAFIAQPAVIDLTQEDDQVNAAFTAVNEARSRLPQPKQQG